MARPLRIEYQGALYHITSRGNNKQDIYLRERDFQVFLSVLSNSLFNNNVICHAYCLMNNHYHLLVETPDGNLSKFMHDLNSAYTQKFNFFNKRVGHLFQGRYKSFVVEKESYLLELARYIILNPVRAGFVEDPEEWNWSSYRSMMGVIKIPKWLCVDFILGMFSKNKRKAQLLYCEFVKLGINCDSPFKKVDHGFILGSPQFVDFIWEKSSGSEAIKDIPRSQRIIGRPTLDQLFEKISNKKDRDNAIRFARIRCGYSVSDIARFLDLANSTIGQISRKNEK